MISKAGAISLALGLMGCQLLDRQQSETIELVCRGSDSNAALIANTVCAAVSKSLSEQGVQAALATGPAAESSNRRVLIEITSRRATVFEAGAFLMDDDAKGAALIPTVGAAVMDRDDPAMAGHRLAEMLSIEFQKIDFDSL